MFQTAIDAQIYPKPANNISVKHDMSNMQSGIVGTSNIFLMLDYVFHIGIIFWVCSLTSNVCFGAVT